MISADIECGVRRESRGLFHGCGALSDRQWPGCRLTALLYPAPPLEYQCSSCGNSSRTAIRKKKEKSSIACCRKTGCCCRPVQDDCTYTHSMPVDNHNSHEHNHTTHVLIFISMCIMLVFIFSNSMHRSVIYCTLTAAKCLLLHTDVGTHLSSYCTYSILIESDTNVFMYSEN